jgi:hypothetical protein
MLGLDRRSQRLARVRIESRGQIDCQDARGTVVDRGDYWLVPGQEEPRSTFGHIIGLNMQDLARTRDLSTYDYYDLAFRRIHEQPGTLVGFAHLA